MPRPRVRRLLKQVGLLEVAREARDWIGSLTHLRSNAPFWLHGSGDGLPTPPLRLVRLATGTSSLAWSFHSGALAATSIEGALERNGIDIRTLRRILDFGCGYGRVVRHWPALHGEVHGCDYNAAAVGWCVRNLAFARFRVNQLEPPLSYPDDYFDLVYALSVFTHLPGPLLFAWMREMSRVLKVGGFLIVTTHGDAYLGQMTPDEQRQFRSGQPVVRHEDVAGTNLCGVYFSEEYVRHSFSRGFRIVDFLPQGARGNPPQDLVLLQKVSESES